VLGEAGTIAGTLPYMSPEQIRGEPLDTRSDIFSFGTLLYELVTGAHPFAGATAADTISAVLTHVPIAPRRDDAAVPAELQRIVRKCLEKDRNDRYQTADDLALDLRNVGREPRADLVASGVASPTPVGHRLAQALVVVLALAAAAAGVYWRSTATGPVRSVAVLPLADPLVDAESEYQTDGITDSIIDRLSKLPELKVTSHNAVFRYKGRDVDPRTVGRELGVEAVLMGRVDRRGDGLTIRLELIDATDNSRIWGQQYDRGFGDLLSIQRDVPTDISEQLRVRLNGEARQRLAQQDTSSPEAYELYLKGRYAWETWSQEGSRRAIDYFQQAIARDPNYALAYSGMADAYMVGTGTGIPVRDAHRRAREAATRALALDPSLGEAHASLSQILLYDDWDFAGAERELKRALELSPNYVDGHHMYSHFLLIVGRHEESLVECRTIAELDPLSPLAPDHFGYHYLYTRQYDAAVTSMLSYLKIDDSAAGRVQIADAYHQNGMHREAVEHFVQALIMV
jgi:serine/threonine-protein kinase